MSQLGKSLFRNPFHRRKKSRDAKAQIDHQEDGPTNVLLPTPSSQSSTQPTQPASKQAFTPLDLWKVAYDHVNDGEQRILSTVRSPTHLDDERNHSQTNALIGEKLINAALSFKDIISAVATFDPTQHAASAWIIVSLGLTMTKNRSDLRDTLFESSEYLADVLTQRAFIEKNFYLRGNFSIKDVLGNAIDPSAGRKLLDWVTAITEHPLTELKASVEKERENIFQWIGLVKQLQRGKGAEDILYQIEKLTESVNHVNEKFSLANLYVAEGAFCISYNNQHEDFCLPDTRTDLCRQIFEWAESDGKFIFWLNGMAGTGKSTVAQILVTRHRRLVPDILNAIQDDPNIAFKFLNQSMRIVIVIDALDECDKEDDVRIILQLLFKLLEIESVHLRVFLTSRPELPIRFGFKQNKNHLDLVVHELPAPVIEHDIRLFLKHKLSEIQDERSLPPAWPGNETIEELVQMAVPLFIFAATACRFIKKGTHPKKRLQKLLEFQPTTATTQMDKIYLPVLNQLTGDEEGNSKELVEELQDIVGVIIVLTPPPPPPPLSIESLARLLQISAGDISELLASLHSVLNIPSRREAPVRILHLSFRDYLLITDSPFHVHEQETHRTIAIHCLRVMATELKHNICCLASYGTQRMDVDNQVINQHLSAELKYSCHYWHFLHWLEALSLIGSISEAVEIIDTLESSIWKSMGAEVSDFLYGARFTLENTYIASIAPLQLYCTYTTKGGNLWSPSLQTLEGHSGSVPSVAFPPDGQTLASGSADHAIKVWDSKTGTELQTLKGHRHSGSVQSVAFSPDGQTLVLGFDNATIKIWEAKSGALVQTLKGHPELYLYPITGLPGR
ncbi:uncharacterized protein BDW43DRAFT_321130 [Aspergillus alliaceus]|uniref:uncharacterized protein n=1 Tax=Petromyces alliaceus TaxID=209559 RepID=UPI0012A3DEF4|nr:uncharacterized protein BDW43DRAFT_321130 [Aspergillus alliaceus]KAB8237945.1 hypothetical protein BDW43DRAFT_321130 [Aspergillus alliaceus]